MNSGDCSLTATSKGAFVQVNLPCWSAAPCLRTFVEQKVGHGSTPNISSTKVTPLHRSPLVVNKVKPFYRWKNLTTGWTERRLHRLHQMTGHQEVMPPGYELVKVREWTKLVMSTTAGYSMSTQWSPKFSQACSECSFAEASVSIVPYQPGWSHVGTNNHPFHMAQPPAKAPLETSDPAELGLSFKLWLLMLMERDLRWLFWMTSYS